MLRLELAVRQEPPTTCCGRSVRAAVAATAFLSFVLAGPLLGQSPEALEAGNLPTPGPSKVLFSQQVDLPAEEVPLRVPTGFRISAFAENLERPREMLVLPSGAVLAVESAAGRVRYLRDGDGDGRAETERVWVDGLERPYGILSHDGFVYVANTGSVVRFAVKRDESAGRREEVIPRLQYEGKDLFGRGHWTRDILFSRDGKRLYVSVGSMTNNDAGEPAGRAAILEYDAEGASPRLFATGLRNPVSITWRPGTDELWATVNERDGLGNDLVPDYVTRVREGGFYGWPFYYVGSHPDPRHEGRRPELADRVIVPDVLLPSHVAALGLAFYDGEQFPEEYQGSLFVALHGSWNRDPAVGYEVIVLRFRDGKPDGRPESFLGGFLAEPSTGKVYGRPVAPLVLPDGSLLVSDDGAGRIWRVTHGGAD